MAIWVLKRIMNPDITNYDLSKHTEFVLDSHTKQIYTIGRGKACDILLASLFVSRYHCNITFSGPDGIPHICDQKSENGTFINGHKMSIGHTKELQVGCTIGVGVDTNDDIACWLFTLAKQEDVKPRLGRPPYVGEEMPKGRTKVDGPRPPALVIKSERDGSIIVLDSDCDSDDDVVVLSPNPPRNLTPVVDVAQPRETRPLKETCADSDEECMIIENIPGVTASATGECEGVSSVALKNELGVPTKHANTTNSSPGVTSSTTGVCEGVSSVALKNEPGVPTKHTNNTNSSPGVTSSTTGVCEGVSSVALKNEPGVPTKHTNTTNSSPGVTSSTTGVCEGVNTVALKNEPGVPTKHTNNTNSSPGVTSSATGEGEGVNTVALEDTEPGVPTKCTNSKTNSIPCSTLSETGECEGASSVALKNTEPGVPTKHTNNINSIPYVTLSVTGKGEQVGRPTTVALEDATLKTATRESLCTTDALTLVDTSAASGETSRENEVVPNDRNSVVKALEASMTPEGSRHTTNTDIGNYCDNETDTKSNIPVGKELRVEATSTNTTKIHHEFEVEDQHKECVKNMNSSGMDFEPTVNSGSSIKLCLTPETSRDKSTNHVQQEFVTVLKTEDQGNAKHCISAHTTEPSIKKGAMVVGDVKIQTDTIHSKSVNCHMEIPVSEDISNGLAVIANSQVTSPVDVDVKPRFDDIFDDPDPVSSTVFKKSDLSSDELNYTNCDIVEILTDDDDEEAPFPSSQNAFRGGGVESADEVSTRAASPDADSSIVCDDTEDDDDDDDSVDLWYGRLSQESGMQNRLKVEEFQDDQNDSEHGANRFFSVVETDINHSPAGSSEDSGHSLSEVDSVGSTKRKIDFGGDSSDDEDIFIHRPKRLKNAIVSISEDEELPARRRFSEPLPAFKPKRGLFIDTPLDVASRRRSVEQPTSKSTLCRPSDSNKDLASRYQCTELDPTSTSKSPSGTDSDTDLIASTSSKKKRQKLSRQTPVADKPFSSISTNHDLETNYISGPDKEFPIESSECPSNHIDIDRSIIDDNIFAPQDLETREQASAHTSDSEQEELMALVSREIKIVDKSWHRRKDERKPKLIEALPMPHRRSHQRGISENEAVRLFEKKSMNRKTCESLKKESIRKKPVKEHKPAKEKISTKGVKDYVSPIKKNHKVSVATKIPLNLYQRTATASEKDKKKMDKKRKLKEIAVKEKAGAEEKAKAAAALNSKKVQSKPVVKMTDKSRTILLAQDFNSSSKCNPAPQAKRRLSQHQAPQPQTVTQDVASSSSCRPDLQDKQIPPQQQQRQVPQPIIQNATFSSKSNLVQRQKHLPIPLPPDVPKHQPMTKSILPKIPLLKDRPRPKHPSGTNTTDSDKLASRNSLTLTKVAPAVNSQLLPLATVTSTLKKKSCLSTINLAMVGKPKEKKMVRFVSEVSIKYFEPDNKPFKSVGTSKDYATPNHPRLVTPVRKSLYDTLNFILGWNGRWFQEQLEHNADRVPPVHGTMQRIQMLSQFTSYSDYWKVMNPLMLLNLWACISNDESSSRKQKMIYLFAIDNQVPCKEDASLCRVYCHTLLSAQMKGNFPSIGELVMLQLNSPGPTNTDSQSTQVTISHLFGYVERFVREGLCDESIIHERLADRIADPQEVLRLTVLIKKPSRAISKERLARIKVLSYIRPSLRSFQAVAALSTSPLCKYILRPRVEHYTLPNQLQHNEISNLKGLMNKAQYAAVCRTAEVCLSDEPKICMIQGPPGTGKSYVIIHLIQAILRCTRMANSSEHYRILLCAPSNAALDELVRRLIAVRSSMPKDERFKLVRTGVVTHAMDPTVRSVSLEELVKIDLAQQARRENGHASLSSMQLEINTLKAKIHAAQLQVEAAKRNKIVKSVDMAYMKLATYKRRLANLESTGTMTSRTCSPQQRRETERRILRGANIVASTLMSCTSSVMEAAFMHDENGFGCCIIDEASQCSEPENLLPLLLSVKTLVLVGDPMQLPATTVSKVAKDYGFGTSLFARLSDCFADLDPSPIQFLHEQYRMHPNILRWPNFRFYSNRLITASQTREQRQSPLVPYLIIKHDCLQDNDIQSNQGEAELVNTLVNCIMDCKSTKHLKIGIITPYSQQRYKLTCTIQRKGVTISTVDGFQGKESDVIIMSCVRTTGTGFMSDQHRLNVALTRAKYCMIICANFQSLNENSTWRSLHDDGIQRNTLRHLSSVTFHNSELLRKMLMK